MLNNRWWTCKKLTMQRKWWWEGSSGTCRGITNHHNRCYTIYSETCNNSNRVPRIRRKWYKTPLILSRVDRIKLVIMKAATVRHEELPWTREIRRLSSSITVKSIRMRLIRGLSQVCTQRKRVHLAPQMTALAAETSVATTLAAPTTILTINHIIIQFLISTSIITQEILKSR